MDPASFTKIENDLRELKDLMEYHRIQGHADLVSQFEFRRQIQVILKELIGPINELSGEREDERGLVYKVNSMWHLTQNGGVPAKLKSSDRVAIWVALIAGLASAITALVAGI